MSTQKQPTVDLAGGQARTETSCQADYVALGCQVRHCLYGQHRQLQRPPETFLQPNYITVLQAFALWHTQAGRGGDSRVAVMKAGSHTSSPWIHLMVGSMRNCPAGGEVLGGGLRRPEVVSASFSGRGGALGCAGALLLLAPGANPASKSSAGGTAASASGVRDRARLLLTLPRKG